MFRKKFGAPAFHGLNEFFRLGEPVGTQYERTHSAHWFNIETSDQNIFGIFFFMTEHHLIDFFLQK